MAVRGLGRRAVMSGHDHDYERFRSAASRTSSTAWAAPGSTRSTNRALPRVEVPRTEHEHGAMLITATSTGITYEFWTFDGKMIDSFNVPKRCN